ncbi:unnamed protein product [Ectocarpus sp. CCAP 1310/34]|nr:unnamed protein product [Ectocarpus sp. CCAP 1310/34]
MCATSVQVKVDLPSYRITVVDNGRGIPAETLRSLTATERASSKANSAVEMQHASTYGFRGEALYSLALTSLLEIQSRYAGKEPHAKVVREGEVLHFGPSRAPARAGTIVTLRDAFFKWPVRRKAANEVTEMTRIKDCVSRMALVNNSVAITVQDSAKSKEVVRATATGSATRTFAQVFSSDKLSLARKVEFSVCVTSKAANPRWWIHLPFCICSIGSRSGMVGFSIFHALAFNFKQFRITGYLSPPSSTACHWSKEFQELFPVFVLNLECPRSEVDIMSDPEKTWIEFSDWAAARNACISMLLAFLSRFPHAVPSSVLRDLRRAFHKNEGGGGDAWKPASPPPPPAARGASPDPGPSPSPPPMQLGTPDVGVSPAGAGSPLESCAWMGRDREVGGIGVEAMDEGSRGEGVLYPSPASRFGARDTGPSSSSWRMPGLSFIPGGGIGDDNVPGSSVAVSPYFAASFEDDGKSRYHEGYDDDGHPTSSPYFARCHHYDGRRSPPDKRLRGRQLALGEYTGGEEERRRRMWDPRPSALGAEAGAPYPPPSFAAVRYEGLGIEDNALRDQTRGSRGHADSSGGGWAAEGPPGGIGTSDFLPPSSEEEPVFDDPPPPNETSSSAQENRGNGRHSSRNDGQRWQSGGGGPPPPPSIASSTRGSRRGGWLRHLQGVTEMRPGEEDLVQGQQQLENDAADQGSLSRLFDYAFADSDGRLPTGPERTGALDEWGVRGGVRSSSPRLLPRGEGGGGGTVAGRKAFVGVTVRRPPSPQFAFMNEERSSPGGAGVPPPAPYSPGRQQSPPPEARQRETLPPPSRETGGGGGGGGARTCNPVNQQQLGARTRSPARATTSPHQPSRGFPCRGDGDTPGAWGAAPVFGGTAPLGSALWMASSSSSPKTGGAPAKGGTLPLSKKRRRPETPGSSWGGAYRRGSPSIGRWAGRRMEDAERHRSPPPPAIDRQWGVVNNSPGGEGDGDGGVGLGDGWLRWARGHGRERNSGGGSWGRRGDDTPPSAAGDRATPAAEAAPAPATPATPATATAPAPAAVIAPATASASATATAPAPAPAEAAPAEAAPAVAVARLLQADNDGLGWHDDASPTPRGGADEPRHHPEHVGAASQAGAPPLRRDERVCAAEGESLGPVAQGEAAETTPWDASVNNKEGDQTERPAPAGGQQDACRVEGGGGGGGGSGGARSSKEDRMRGAGAALAYDQDVLGGDGLGGGGEEEEKPDTVDGVLGKFLATGGYDSCHVSDAGGRAVYSPQGPGGGRARKAGGEAEKAAAETDSQHNPLPGRRERQIPQVLQAGQDEVGAGAGAVAVTVTPEELGEALLIGQVRGSALM